MAESEENIWAKDPNVKDVVVVRSSAGFGFNIKGTTQEGGVMQAIAGSLYPPLQYVSAVDTGGAAYQGGLRKNDRILIVNGEDVQGANHSHVVDLVIQGGDRLELKVLRITDEEAERLRRLEEDLENKKRGVSSSRVEVRSFYHVQDVKAFTVFNIYIKGEYFTSRRFSEFDKLHSALKQRFRWFKFPSLPPKKSNGFFGPSVLKEDEVKERMKALGEYLAEVFSADDIFNSEIVKRFLELAENQKPPNLFRGQTDPNRQPRPKAPVARAPRVVAPTQQTARPKISVTLADDRVITVEVQPSTTVGEAEHMIGDQLELTDQAQCLFALFDGTKENEHLRLRPDSIAVSHQCDLFYEKWLFTKSQETFCDDDEACVPLLYAQALKGLTSGRISAGANALARLETLQQKKDKLAYVRQARKLKTYAMHKSNPCSCDYPEDDSTVIVFVDVHRILLQACDEDGTPQDGDDAVTEFLWDIITKWKRKEDVIGFRYTAEGENGEEEEETVTLTTTAAEHLASVFERVQKERDWAEELLENESTSEENFFMVR